MSGRTLDRRLTWRCRTIRNAIHVAKIATGEIEDKLPYATRSGGLKGGSAHAQALTPERRSEIAQMGVEAHRRNRVN